jgi:DNA-binding YbaB/EbfC family protein
MAINPFDILKQFGNIQERMGEVQERLSKITVTGSAGGGMVEVQLNGHMDVQQVKIFPEAVDPEDIAMLQDLVRAAFSDGMFKLKEKIREEVSSLTGGLPLPPGLMGM